MHSRRFRRHSSHQLEYGQLQQKLFRCLAPTKNFFLCVVAHNDRGKGSVSDALLASNAVEDVCVNRAALRPAAVFVDSKFVFFLTELRLKPHCFRRVPPKMCVFFWTHFSLRQRLYWLLLFVLGNSAFRYLCASIY